MQNNYLYGQTSPNAKFYDVFVNANQFKNDYNNSGLGGNMRDDSLTQLYYLLYAEFGASTIASNDPNMFKYQCFSLMFKKGQQWEVKLDAQKKIMELISDEERLREQGINISNTSSNPNYTGQPTTQFDALGMVDSQMADKSKAGILTAYNQLIYSLKDVTSSFIDDFRKLFIKVVAPITPTYYTEDIE